MAWLLILVPLLAAAAAAAVPSSRWRPWLVPVGGLAHLVLVGLALTGVPVTAFQGWLVLDPLGKLVLGVHQRAVLSVRAVYAGLSGATSQTGPTASSAPVCWQCWR